MPVLLPSVGTDAQATAELGDLKVVQVNVATFGGPAAALVHRATVTGLPNVFLYVYPTTLSGAAINVTWTPVASFSVNAGAGIAASAWEPLTAPMALVAVTPVYFRDWIPGATAVGIQLNIPAPAAGIITARCIVGASG